MSREKLEIQAAVDARERAQETCPEYGRLADRETVVTSADGDTAVELVCRSAKCGWRT